MSASEHICHQTDWFKALVECYEEHRQFCVVRTGTERRTRGRCSADAVDRRRSGKALSMGASSSMRIMLTPRTNAPP